MKVLLIQPAERSSIGLQSFILAEPLGLETVASSLIDEHEVQILDARIESSVREKLSSFKPEAVGVAASFTSNVYSAFKVLEIVKGYNPRIHTFVGGYHATLCHSDFAGWADVAVLGEGEFTTPELLRSWEGGRALAEVEGIAFQSDDGWRATPLRPLISDLDQTPLPSRHLTAKYREHYFQGNWQPCAFIETTRGCPYRCNFCSVWRFHRGRFRMRSPERVIQELSTVEGHYVSFTDDNFLIDASRVKTIFQKVREMKIDKWFQIQARADAIVRHAEVLRESASSGLKTVFIGFESITQKGLDALKKHTFVGDNEEATNILKKFGINIWGTFIVDPGFVREDFANLRSYVRRLKIGFPLFSVLTPLPGTTLHQERKKELITHNYELFDLQHAVLSARLGLKKFYQEYAKLYRSTYLPYFFLPLRVTTRLWGGPLASFLKRLWKVAWSFRLALYPRALVKSHRDPPQWLRKAILGKDE